MSFRTCRAKILRSRDHVYANGYRILSLILGGVYACMYVCMYVCRPCMCGRMLSLILGDEFVVCVYVCMHVCMYVCMYVDHVYVNGYLDIEPHSVR